MKRITAILFFSVFAVALVQIPQVVQAKGACKADVEKFCKDLPAERGAIHRCLKENQDRLSQACQDKFARAKQHRQACKADKEKFCKDVQPGEGRIKACMQAHESELSEACRGSYHD